MKALHLVCRLDKFNSCTCVYASYKKKDQRVYYQFANPAPGAEWQLKKEIMKIKNVINFRYYLIGSCFARPEDNLNRYENLTSAYMLRNPYRYRRSI